MDKVTIKLQIFFEQPFWVGVVERSIDGKLYVCKITFGEEPKDYEVNEFIQKNYYTLGFSPAVDSRTEIRERVNPKRLQRQVKKEVSSVGIGTKSQQALKLQQEQCKIERKKKSRLQKDVREQFQFELKQQKRKEKHRGR